LKGQSWTTATGAFSSFLYVLSFRMARTGYAIA
jgi:hypothetical protein